MIVDSMTLDSKKEFVISPPQFELAPHGQNPFGGMPPTAVMDENLTFNFSWGGRAIEIEPSRTGMILDEFVNNSRLDVERFPSSPNVHANYGLALLNRGNFEEAANAFLTALGMSPQHYMSLINLARTRTLQGRFEEAISLYRKTSGFYPNEIGPLVSLAYIFLQIGQPDNATEILKKALDIDSDAISTRYLMAVSLLLVGKSQEAIKHLRFAARHEVRSPAIQQTLGVAYLMAGDAKGAVRSFKTALTLAPEMKSAVHALANVLAQHGQTDRLIELLPTYLEKQPDDIVARELLAGVYWARKQFAQARLQLTTALSHLPGDGNDGVAKERAKLFNNIGACFDRQGDTENAIRWIERSIEIHRQFDSVPFHNLVKLYLRKKQTNNAWKVLDKYKEAFPNNHQAPALEASILESERQYDKAIELLRKEIATGEADSIPYGTLGWFLTEFKCDFENAQQVMSEGLRRYPGDAALINNLAYSLLMSGRPEEARQVLVSLPKNIKDIRQENLIALQATWGLLYLWEGNIPNGRMHYEYAERMALEAGLISFTVTIRQKMHIELAKAFLRQSQIELARAEVISGLSIKNGREIFERELGLLRDQLEP